MGKFKITIATLPNRVHPVAEIYYNNMYWAQISQETDELIVQFHSNPKEQYWEFVFDEAIEALLTAKKLLING